MAFCRDRTPFFDILNKKRRPVSKILVQKRGGYYKKRDLGIHLRQPAAANGCQRMPTEMGHGPRLGTTILTRAGDQDDVSSEQTPSNHNLLIKRVVEAGGPIVTQPAVRCKAGGISGSPIPNLL